MAQIYLARQSGLGSFERHVVLKTILHERASDQRFVTMFLDEAKLAATLNHQNVAQVYEVDQADGAYFMAMEYVHGENARAILETSLRRGWTIPLELAVMIISGAAAGLHHAHERRGKNGAPLNIVHRDVSPANIMVGYDGSVKVLDFGIAKAEERATKTVGGTIKGKYGYMSPEQCKGKPIDRRSDIFALGIVLYELTTLRRAFKGNDDFETMKRIVAGDVVLPSIAVPGYPRELEAIVLTAMANDPSARFQNGQELIEALDAFAVRAKLTGSNTAMGRFMVQLFGAKREPWVESAPSEKTQITAASDLSDGDNEKTTISAHREIPTDPSERREPRVTMRDTVNVPPRAVPPEPVSPPQEAAAWSGDTAPPKRPSSPSKMSSRPGSVNEAGPPEDDDDPLNMTLAGHAPSPAAAPRTHPAPGQPPPLPVTEKTARHGVQLADEVSDAGVQPLFPDPRLDRDPPIGARTLGEGVRTRLSTELSDFQLRSNMLWWTLALLLGIGVAVVILAILLP